MKHLNYDIIIIGGGHAGIEAASASCRIGSNTCLVTKSVNDLGKLSCNPSVGGTAKGIIVKEIDALDGIMPKAIDNTGIHFKILNKNKGPAVWGIRAQVDRLKYKQYIKKIITNHANLKIEYDTVGELIIQNKKVIGIKCKNIKIYANSIVLTSGTFLNSSIYIGEKKYYKNKFNNNMIKQLRRNEIKMMKFKTGTPPRLYSKSIDWNKLSKQLGDRMPYLFSGFSRNKLQKSKTCYFTYTNKNTHKIVLDNLHKSSIYSGKISAHGPRYCPSIEDKIIKFQDKNRHLIFLEPETINNTITYPNGISTSLPIEIQKKILHSIVGLKKVRIIKFGYAIEYNIVNPKELNTKLESIKIRNLFFAGQINGTTGYEEAAGQGVIAGVNAALNSENKKVILSREKSYIGVMISDLTMAGTVEPYRIMTSRAEYRIKMRNDNAFYRLYNTGIKYGILSNKRTNEFQLEEKEKIKIKKLIRKDIKIDKNEKIDKYINRLKRKYFYIKNVEKKFLINMFSENLYQKYKNRLKKEINLLREGINFSIPTLINFKNIISLSSEMKKKLNNIKPRSIEEIKRIHGITPSALVAISVYLKFKKI